jgi:hypothetical protein
MDLCHCSIFSRRESFHTASDPDEPRRNEVRFGSNAKYSIRVDVFRFASKLGHYSGAIVTSRLCHEETHASQQI